MTMAMAMASTGYFCQKKGFNYVLDLFREIVSHQITAVIYPEEGLRNGAYKDKYLKNVCYRK